MVWPEGGSENTSRVLQNLPESSFSNAWCCAPSSAQPVIEALMRVGASLLALPRRYLMRMGASPLAPSSTAF